MTIVHQQYPIWKGLGSLANRRSSPLKIFRSRENRDWGYCMLSVPARFFFGVPFINPRRTCAARVTILGLCVCLSVFYHSV